ncbi:MAG: hypothetical protein KAX05_07120 [Bacteroidales bacterium]|nr:hypothetical protein [Bacteroidales bacterium]
MKSIKKTLILCLSIALILFLNACEKDDPFKDEYESNNSKSEATDLTLGSQISASLAKGDHDWYYFTIDNSGIIDIALIEITNNSSDMEIVFSLYDDQGNQLGSSFTGNAGTGLNIRLSTRDGSYYIELSEKSGDKEGHYSLKVTDQNANDDNEPDDDFSDSKVRIITSIPANFTGTIVADADANNTYGDFEFYKITVNGNCTVNVTVTPTGSDMELNMEVFDENKDSIETITGGEGDVVRTVINNTELYDLQYYVKLGGLLGDSYNGDYSITFDD